MSCRTPFVALALLIGSAGVSAQEISRPLEIGVQFSSLGLDRSNTTGVAGIGLRVDVRLTRRLDVEGRVMWFPVEATTEFEAQGGRTGQFALGVRGRFFKSRRASVYGVLLPELLHFTNAVIGFDGPEPIFGGATHFALDWGIGGEFYVTSRWTAHAEFTGPLYAVEGIELARVASGDADLVVSIAPRFVNPGQFSAGVSYRLGRAGQEGVENPVEGRWEAGGQLTRATLTDALELSLRHVGAVGGFLSYRLAPGVYADAALNLFTQKMAPVTPFDGGHLTQAVAGVKLGVRKDRYGLFGKIRFGVNSQSAAPTGIDASGFHRDRFNALAVDVGGVFEHSLGRRLLLRFDGGDTVSVFHSATFNDRGSIVSIEAPSAKHGLQITWGAGWRF